MSRYLNRGRRQFSEEEKRAFHGGRAYGAAKMGRRVSFRTKSERDSFSNGVKSVRK